MSGELWRGTIQLAKEVVYGTYLASTKRGYYEDASSHFALARAPRMWKFATGTRDNQRAFSQGPKEVSGTLVQPLSADEIIEIFLMGIQGGVTPTASKWTFTPGSSMPDSASFEWQDGANPWHISGVYVDKIDISGSANGPNTVTATLFGKDLVAGAITPALAQRTPSVLQGWQAAMSIDNAGVTPGTTPMPGTLVNWKVSFDNGMVRKYMASNANTLSKINIDAMKLTAVLTFEASTAGALAEFTNFNTPTPRVIQLAFGHDDGSPVRYVDLNIPANWTIFGLDGSDALSRTYQLTADYLYDPVLGYGFQAVVENSIATAW